MIPAKHTRFHTAFFEVYTRFMLRRHFHRVRMHHEAGVEGPLLVIANHFSWWDGFIIFELNRRYLQRKFHVMMLEEQLQKNSFLRNIGAFSINRNSRSILDSMVYADHILQKKENLLLFFPQGEFQTMHLNHLKFNKGIHRLLRNMPEKSNLLMVCNLIDYFEHKKPVLSVYTRVLQTPLQEDPEQLYNAFLHECISRQKQ